MDQTKILLAATIEILQTNENHMRTRCHEYEHTDQSMHVVMFCEIFNCCICYIGPKLNYSSVELISFAY